jgi:hypothetical protein
MIIREILIKPNWKTTIVKFAKFNIITILIPPGLGLTNFFYVLKLRDSQKKKVE